MAPVSRDDLNKAETRLTELKKRYLEEHGWAYTCKTPGSTWLWRKVYRDDIYFANTGMALVLEEALSPQ